MPKPSCFMYDERAKLDVRHHGFALLIQRDEIRKIKSTGEKRPEKRFRVAFTGTRDECHNYRERHFSGKPYRIQGIRLDHTPIWIPTKREKGDRE